MRKARNIPKAYHVSDSRNAARSKLQGGQLSDAEYRQAVGLPARGSTGIITPELPKRPETKPEPSIIGGFRNWNSMDGNQRASFLKAVFEGKVSDSDLLQAQKAYTGRQSFASLWELIQNEAKARNTPFESTSSGKYYLGLDKLERERKGLVDTRSDSVIRRRRLRRFVGL